MRHDEPLHRRQQTADVDKKKVTYYCEAPNTCDPSLMALHYFPTATSCVPLTAKESYNER